MTKRTDWDKRGFFQVVRIERSDGADFWNVVDLRGGQIRSSWLSRSAALVAMADLCDKESSS
jgi:hypothetical protein